MWQSLPSNTVQYKQYLPLVFPFGGFLLALQLCFPAFGFFPPVPIFFLAILDVDAFIHLNFITKIAHIYVSNKV